MRTKKTRKRAYYTGILAEPIEWVSPIVPPGTLPKTTLDQVTGYCRRLEALWEHFGIDRSQPGWWRNFALSLALRHEPDLVRGAGVAYAELFAKYSVDPNQPEADQLLALALVHRHIPGMRLEPSAPRKSPKARLSTIDLVRFTLAVVTIGEYLKKTIGSSSDRKVVARLVNPRLLKPILSAPEIAEVKRIINNRRQSEPGPLSERALRDYLHQMRKALHCLREGRANPFQQQFVCEALPLIHQLSRTDTKPGQI